MSADNGVIRIGRKGRKKFAFGEDGAPFEVDVVTTFQQWVDIDETFRDENRIIPEANTHTYHQAALDFVTKLSGSTGTDITVAEALDFVARLREQYDEVAVFFRPKLRGERESPDSSESEMLFSEEETVEEENSPSLMNTSLR